MYAGFTTMEVPYKQNYDQGGLPTSRIMYDQGAGCLAEWWNYDQGACGWLAEAQRRPERGPDRPRKAEWG